MPNLIEILTIRPGFYFVQARMRTKATVFSFFLIVGLYFLYGWGIVPLILPNQSANANSLKQIADAPLDNTRQEIEHFLPLLPENGWERDTKQEIHLLQFGQTVVLFGKDHIDGQFVRLEPCTVLLLPDTQEFIGDEDSQNRLRQTIILRTQEYAEIQFNKEFDISKLPLPEIETGRLFGKVTIQSDMKDPGKQDDLYLEAESIAFTETAGSTEIKTLKDVHFEFGYHSGTGTNLTLQIALADLNQPQSNRELSHVVFQKLKTLRLVFPENANVAPKITGSTIVPDGPASLLDVYCKGRFEFAANPAEQGWTASFYQDVNMTRNNPDKTVDRLTAEEVHLTLKEAQQGTLPNGLLAQADTIKTDGTKASQFDSLEPALFVARGKPGQGNQQPVPARLTVKQSGDVTLIGDEIFLDLRKSFLSLSTRNESGASPFVEMIVQEQYSIKSEQCLQYTFNKNGTLGKFVSEGKGSLTGNAGAGPSAKNIHLEWNEMQMQPHPAVEEQIVLKLYKGISARMTGFGTMTADALDLIFSLDSQSQTAQGQTAQNQTVRNQTSRQPAALQSAVKPAARPAVLPKSGLLLDHALIKDNVVFTTSTGTCRVDQLTIFFTNIIGGRILQSRWAPQILAAAPPAVPKVGKGTAAGTTSQSPIRQVQYTQQNARQNIQPQLQPLVPMQPLYQPPAPTAPAYANRMNNTSQPAQTKPNGFIETQNLLGIKSSPSGGRFEMTGNQMRMEVVVQNNQSSANIVAVEGNVRLKENVNNNAIGNNAIGSATNSAIEIIGDTVTIWNPADATTQINIKGRASGNDAIFKGKGIELRARELNLSRLHNTFWSPGAGQLIAQTGQIKTPGLPVNNSGNANQLNTDKLNDNKLYVEWNKEMRCDGKVLQFIGLPDKNGNRVQVVHQTQSLWCTEMEIQLNRQVMFFDDQSPVEPKAVVIRCSQDVYVRNEQIDAQKKRKSIDTARVVNLQYDVEKNYIAAEGPGEMSSIFIGSGQGFDPKASGVSSSGEKLNYLAVWFRDTVNGTLLGGNKMVTINGKVQAAYCPASGWNDVVDVNNLTAARRTGYTLECERLEIAEMPNPVNLSQSSMELTASEDAIIEGGEIYGKAQTIKYTQAKSVVNMSGNVGLSIRGQTSIRDVQSVQYNIETNSVNFAQLRGVGVGL